MKFLLYTKSPRITAIIPSVYNNRLTGKRDNLQSLDAIEPIRRYLLMLFADVDFANGSFELVEKHTICLRQCEGYLCPHHFCSLEGFL